MLPHLYLDHNASSPLDPRVLAVLIESSELFFGNPSSQHQKGQQARSALQKARSQIAGFLGFRPQELTFCSSGTEGMNMLLRGWCQMHPGGHVITSSSEHACVYETLRLLQRSGQKVTFLSTGLHGSVHPCAVEPLLQETQGPILLVFMAVNNETGVKTDLHEMSELATRYKAPLCVDGVALLGKESFKLPQGVSAFCCSAHKIHGPKGIAAVALRGWSCPALLTGGGQEFGRRAGTEAVPLIMAFAEAVKCVEREQGDFLPRIKRLRDLFEQLVCMQLADVVRHGSGQRVGNTSNLSFLGCDGEALVIALDQAGIAASHGSACASGATEPSRVLKEMGVPKEQASSAVRFSLSRSNTEEEIRRVVEALCYIVPNLRRADR